MMEEVGIEFPVFASLISDENQKPGIGMWRLFCNLYPQIPSELDPDSFYVGDRSGDPQAEDPMFRKGRVEIQKEELLELGLAEDTPVGDDSLFALRIGLNYYLPSALPLPEDPIFTGRKELLVMVGQQGSGKTTWACQVAQKYGYIHIASEEVPDALVIKDKKKRLRVIRELLSSGESVIVDATHPSKQSRLELIEIARSYGVPSRIAWLSRPGRPYNELRSRPVPEVALRTYTKNFEGPSLEETTVFRVS